MRKLFLYSLLLIAGLAASQFPAGWARAPISLLTMFCLSFIMIQVGYDFEINRRHSKKYLWDHFVAMTTTVFPWLFCAAYFVFALAPRELWHSQDMWWEALLAGRFAATTSLGVLFSMLVAAGLTKTWFCKKVRTLAIFDDLDTLVLLVPLKFLVLSFNAKLVLLVVAMLAPSWLAWKYVYVAKRTVQLPSSWPWVMLYGGVISLVSEGVNFVNKAIEENVPVHLEVFLPAFIVGCLLARNPSPRRAGAVIDQGREVRREQLVATIVSCCFMALVGLSMPSFVHLTQHKVLDAPDAPAWLRGLAPEALARLQQFPGWTVIALHVLIVTLLSNLGKMFPALCYRKEASFKERLALPIGMCPRGEVGAGVLVVSLSQGVSGILLMVAVLSLALNLLCSGLFVLAAKRLVTPANGVPEAAP